MGNRTSGYGALGDPDFSGQISWHKQQERPDRSLWSVAVYLNNREQERQFFGSEAAADAWVQAQIDTGAIR